MVKNINRIIKNRLKDYTAEHLTLSEYIADKTITVIGSWRYIFMFCAILIAWIVLNTSLIKYDPYPFILLNLILSCIAALQVSIILMGQNRMSEIDRKRDEIAYTINLKDELISEEISIKLDEIMEHMNYLYIMKKFHPLDLERIIIDERKINS